MTVLLCYDESPSSGAVLAQAKRLLDGQKFVLLHVWSPPNALLADAFGDALGGEEEPTIERLERLASRHAGEVAERGRTRAIAEGLEVEARVERAPEEHWQRIVSVADELDAELIVLGTRGRAVVDPHVVGSVSAGVVRHSDRPVLVVPSA